MVNIETVKAWVGIICLIFLCFQKSSAVINIRYMKKRKFIISFIIVLAFCLLLGSSACKRAPDGKSSEKTAGPAARATQTIKTPTLKPPPEKKTAPEKTVATEEMAASSKPRGPITLHPKPEDGTEEKPSSTDIAPLATLSGKKEAGDKDRGKSGEAEVQSLAAPAVAPEETTTSDEAQPVPYEPKIVTSKTNIDIILDASGSMAAPFGATSQSKFDMLRSSLSDVIFEVIQQQSDFPRNIGIRVFGSKYSAGENNCQDTTLLAPMGEPDLGEIRRLLDETTARGKSPIALAMKKAPEDFPAGKTADRVIVLVADGVDNCDGDPCAIAKKIEESGDKYIVHVVAFDVGPLDQEKLECIAKESGGKFFLARNSDELLTSLNDAINSTVPYNLKLSARAGATPLPFNVKIFKAGTQRVVKSDKSLGTKLLSLKPGNYDILIEYASSPQSKKPSKILKGVEILATTRVEQTVGFDLGQITLSAINNEGAMVPARFEITPVVAKGRPGVPFLLEIGAESKTFFLTPGSYSVTADLMELVPEGFSLVEKNVPIKTGENTNRVFRFQKGTLALKGVTTQKEEMPFLIQVYKTGRDKIPIASGAFNRSGGSVVLAPGTYDLIAIGTDGKMIASPRTKVKGAEVRAADTTELTIKFEMGTLKLSAVDGKDNKLPAEFIIREHDSGVKMAAVKSESGSPVTIPIPPGSYDIVAVSLKSELEPKPSVPVPTIVVTMKKTVEKVVKFILGTLRLRGCNAKEQSIRTQFTIYQSGSDEVVTSAPPSNDWMVFDLAPGIYDALATDTTSTKTKSTKTKSSKTKTAELKPAPMIWLRNLRVEDGKSSSHEAIYTTGKIKIIGRGPNNKIIECRFKIFQYGADRELLSGVTGDDWEIFEIEPGKYYLEASYIDEAETVMLKKWINLDIGDNDVVEQVLRF